VRLRLALFGGYDDHVLYGIRFGSSGDIPVKARQVATTGMLAAVAFLLMAAIQVPVLPQAPFLTYDPSDAVGLLAALLYGPASESLSSCSKICCFCCSGPTAPWARSPISSPPARSSP
jgi:hypothetical protein